MSMLLVHAPAQATLIFNPNHVALAATTFTAQ